MRDRGGLQRHHMAGGRYSLEPVCDGHHDIEGAQEEDKMEVGVAVDGPLLLVVHYVLTPPALLLVVVVWKRKGTNTHVVTR